MIASIRRLARRLRRRKPVQSTLTHREAMRLLVEYHFGRLSAEQSSAVEAHVRTCATCHKEGLDHARTESFAALRRLQSVRGVRPSTLERRTVFRVALLCVAAVLVALGTLHGLALLRTPRESTPEPKPLVERLALAVGTIGAHGIVGDPRGHLLAVAGAGSTATITVWQASSGTYEELRWPGSGVPATMAWSPDGIHLAATDGVVVAEWSVHNSARVWAKALPTHASAAVIDATNGQLASTPNLGEQLAQQAFLEWGPDGTLVSATAGAQAPTNAAPVGGLLIGMWRMGGTHLFALPGGGTGVGSRANDTSESGDLDWSPGGDFVLWSRVVQPVALPGATGNSALPGAPPPDVPLANLATKLAARGSGDALAWFAANGSAIALCDRSSAGAPLQIIDPTSSRISYTLPGVCDGLTVTTATWLPNSTTLVLALPGQPVREFPVTLTSS